jgi:hypothetical protein
LASIAAADLGIAPCDYSEWFRTPVVWWTSPPGSAADPKSIRRQNPLPPKRSIPIWYGGHAEMTLRSVIKWGDVWMPLASVCTGASGTDP